MKCCPTCGLEVKDEKLRCPRCLTILIPCKECSGNCLSCLLDKKTKKE